MLDPACGCGNFLYLDFVLDGVDVSAITPELRSPERSTGQVARLAANRGKCFQGPIPVGDGFIISAEEAEALLAGRDARYDEVVRPYLTGDDIAEHPRQAATDHRLRATAAGSSDAVPSRVEHRQGAGQAVP